MMRMICQVTAVITAGVLLMMSIVDAESGEVQLQESMPPQSLVQERIFGSNCDQCANMSNFKTVYCCKIRKTCCPPDKPGYCPPAGTCIKKGLFGNPMGCFFDNQCPENEKCCGSSFLKCCKPNGLTVPVDPVKNPVQALGRAIEQAPSNIKNGIQKLADALNPLNLLSHNPLAGLFKPSQ